MIAKVEAFSYISGFMQNKFCYSRRIGKALQLRGLFLLRKIGEKKVVKGESFFLQSLIFALKLGYATR